LRRRAESAAERSLPLQARRLSCSFAIGESLGVRGDPFLLQQALLNLLDNAIAFSLTGGNIEIALQRRDQHAEVTVRDHGSGAPDYALPQVFDRFYSLASPASGQKYQRPEEFGPGARAGTRSRAPARR